MGEIDYKDGIWQPLPNMKQRPVLDHGYVKLVDFWGRDESIIEAARMSTAKGFQGWDKDAKLLKYLWEHKHYSPFEMAGLTIEVQAPIFVFREWHRHRTLSVALDDDIGIDAYNELSARYTELPDLFYIPSIERIMAGKQSSKNKQSSETGFTQAEAHDIMRRIEHAAASARFLYEELLEEGLSRELARLVISVNQYSRMRASANLRNWLAFLELRLGEGAQYEIQEFAKAVAQIVADIYPRTYSLFRQE